MEFHLRSDESKTGRRIAKVRDKKARSQRKARLKHQGGAATAVTTATSPVASVTASGSNSRGDACVESEHCNQGDQEIDEEIENRDNEEQEGSAGDVEAAR